MKPVSYAALGGAIGAFIRALIAEYLMLPSQLHIALINIAGSFLLTLLYMSSSKRITKELRLILGVGLLGGFTTMSTFSLDVVNHLINQRFSESMIYIGFSVIGSMASCFLAYWMIKRKAVTA